jgi:Beta propeller domain
VFTQFEPLIDAFVELMSKDISANGKTKILAGALSTDLIPPLWNRPMLMVPFKRSPASFSVSNLSDDGDGELAVSCAGACTPSSYGYKYTIDGWVVFAGQGWEWNWDLRGTSSQSTYVTDFSINGTTASSAIIGSFPAGYLLNQYSLNIYEVHIQVATTINSWFVESVLAESGDNASTSWPSATSIIMNQVIILKVLTAAGEMTEEVSRISNLDKEDKNITAIYYFGPIAYVVGTFTVLSHALPFMHFHCH